MRGAELPSKVKWTRPFLPPLEPLSSSAAHQTFIDIADEIYQEDSVKRLLELTGNLPLAVNLIASVASYEGCDKALSRWECESTQMLSDGYDQKSSLDISIMLSFTSTRMTTGAQELLSVMSMLPDGLTESDLVQARLPISDILACKATLIRTSLAFMDKDHKLKVLVPIREHILRVHPPSNVMKLQLRRHLHELLALWVHFKDMNGAGIIPQISQNLGNFNSVLHEALGTECPDVIQNIESVLFLNQFYGRTQNTISPLLLDLSVHMTPWQSHPIFGDYLVECLQSCYYLPVPKSQILMGNKYFESKQPLEQGKTAFYN
jgi:hypothetical protein